MDMFRSVLATSILVILVHCWSVSAKLRPLRVNVQHEGDESYLYSITYQADNQAHVTWMNVSTRFSNSEETPIVHTFVHGSGVSSLRLSYYDDKLYLLLGASDGVTMFYVVYTNVEDDLPLPNINLQISIGNDIAYQPGVPFNVTVSLVKEPDGYDMMFFDWKFFGYNTSAPSPELITLDRNDRESRRMLQETSTNVVDGQYVNTYHCDVDSYEGLVFVQVHYPAPWGTAPSVATMGQTEMLLVHQDTHTDPLPAGFVGVLPMLFHDNNTYVHCTEGKDCLLDCYAFGGELNQVQLYRMGSPVPAILSSVYEWFAEGYFSIGSVAQSDGGEYTCRASNTVGVVQEAIFTIMVM